MAMSDAAKRRRRRKQQETEVGQRLRKAIYEPSEDTRRAMRPSTKTRVQQQLANLREKAAREKKNKDVPAETLNRTMRLIRKYEAQLRGMK